jgi:hypothetical protein
MLRSGALVLAAGLCVAAAVAIGALITGTFDDTSVRVLLSALAAALCTLGGLAGASVLGRERSRDALGEATILLSALTAGLVLILIWQPGASQGPGLGRALGVTASLTLAGGHASLMFARLRSEDTNTVRAFTQLAVGSATAAALLVSGLLSVLGDQPVDSSVWRLLGVLLVLAVLNTLLAPLARRIMGRQDQGSDRGSFTSRSSGA